MTTHIYDLTQRYRDLGGNLAFLSADNFFWRVDLAGEPSLADPALAKPRTRPKRR